MAGGPSLIVLCLPCLCLNARWKRKKIPKQSSRVRLISWGAGLALIIIISILHLVIPMLDRVRDVVPAFGGGLPVDVQGFDYGLDVPVFHVGIVVLDVA